MSAWVEPKIDFKGTDGVLPNHLNDIGNDLKYLKETGITFQVLKVAPANPIKGQAWMIDPTP